MLSKSSLLSHSSSLRRGIISHFPSFLTLLPCRSASSTSLSVRVPWQVWEQEALSSCLLSIQPMENLFSLSWIGWDWTDDYCACRSAWVFMLYDPSTQEHTQPVWADGLDLFVLCINENFLHYYWKNRIMDLLGFNTRRWRFKIILLPWLIFYAGKQAMTLIHNVAVTWDSQNPRANLSASINMYVASAASADILIGHTGWGLWCGFLWLKLGHGRECLSP